MTAGGELLESGGVVPPSANVKTHNNTAPTVRVWDPFIRIFHWSLVGLFILAYVSGDETEWLHLTAGYAIAGLILLRIIWGFVGPRYARFSDFVRTPRQVIGYVHAAIRLRSTRYLGHNPAGGAMIIALLAMIIAVSVTGIMMTTDAFWGAQWVEDLHEWLVNATLVLVGLHVAGVIMTSIEHGENLVKAMFTGRKRAR